MFFFFALLCAVQLAYWLLLRRGFERVQAAQPEAPAGALPPMSAIVAARNEARHLPGLLAALTAQTHPQHELLLADDASEDATPNLIAQAAAHHPALRLVPITDPQPPRKKHALTAAIREARHDLLAFTDADCTPPPAWLETLAAHHAATEGHAVLVGYSPMRKENGGLNYFVRYETMVTALLTAAAVGLRRPYMAVGRNLSYPRPVFEAIGGFAHSHDLLSGDDDLLVQHVARTGAAPVRYVLDPRAFVPSEPPRSWRQWLRQKRRHTSAARFYRRDVNLHLGVFHLSNVLLWLAPLFVWPGGLGLLAFKLLVQYRVLSDAAKAFEETDLLPAQPLWEFLYLLYNTLIAPLGVLFGTRRW